MCVFFFYSSELEFLILVVFCQGKLESYKDIQKNGKELDKDQKTAVAKYDEVLQTLDITRDLYKSIVAIANDNAKAQKKLARTEARERLQQDIAKVHFFCLLSRMSQFSRFSKYFNSDWSIFYLSLHSTNCELEQFLVFVYYFVRSVDSSSHYVYKCFSLCIVITFFFVSC